MELSKKFADIIEKKHQKKINISTLIDVGAYKGFFIKNLNQKKIIEIYSFETQPYYFNYLNRKFKNKSKYKIFKIALSSKKKKLKFLSNNKFEKIKSFSTFPYIYRDVVFKKKDIYTNKK